MKYVQVAKVEIVAKNIVNLDELTTFLADLSTQALNANVKTWINSNLRKYLINNGESKVVKRTNKNSPEWMIKAIENGEVLDLLIIDKKLKDQWSHVVDYLNTETTDVSRISIPQALDKVKAWDEAMIKNSKKTIQYQ
jgi:ethanolamine ammonia-lyase large subunit